MAELIERTARFDAAMLLMRVWLGVAMMTHGWPKVSGNMVRFTAGVNEMGFPAPEVFAWVAALTEFVGGLLIALGLGTRINAVLIALTMFVAAFIRHAPDPFGRKELPITYIVMAIAILILGPGRYALDRLIHSARQRRASRRDYGSRS